MTSREERRAGTTLLAAFLRKKDEVLASVDIDKVRAHMRDTGPNQLDSALVRAYIASKDWMIKLQARPDDGELFLEAVTAVEAVRDRYRELADAGKI